MSDELEPIDPGLAASLLAIQFEFNHAHDLLSTSDPEKLRELSQRHERLRSERIKASIQRQRERQTAHKKFVDDRNEKWKAFLNSAVAPPKEPDAPR